MTVKLLVASLVLLAGLAAWRLAAPAHAEAADKDGGPALVHNVFFTLSDSSLESRKKLVAACKKYLTKHEGEVYFAAGPIVEDLKREVNDRDFDVCLTIVFKTKADHDKYQDHKRHLDFIAECKSMWKKVRVFDSWAEK